MTRSTVLFAVAFIAGQALASPASAQTATTHDWTHGTTLTSQAGAAVAPSADTRATFGGGFGWKINHWTSIEASGAWLVPRQDDDGFSADLMALVNLTRRGRVVPFVGAGVGLYIASFGTSAGSVPDFYQARIPEASAITHRTFTDPMFAFSGGVDVVARGRWSIRPAVDVKLVTDGSRYISDHDCCRSHRVSLRESRQRALEPTCSRNGDRRRRQHAGDAVGCGRDGAGADLGRDAERPHGRRAISLTACWTASDRHLPLQQPRLRADAHSMQRRHRITPSVASRLWRPARTAAGRCVRTACHAPAVRRASCVRRWRRRAARR